MLPSAITILITPPLPISTQLHTFDNNHRLPFSTRVFNPTKPIININKKMATVGDGYNNIPAVSALEQEALIEDGGVPFHPSVDGLQALVNHLSKWIVAVTFGGLVILRHDPLALWAAMGSVLNVMLSVTLKQILKQERPVSRSNSGHGMPSSHAQSIFYTFAFVILSVVQWKGISGVSAILSMFVLATGSYLSWLRVLQRYHTAIQVVVGAIVGSVFSVLWFSAWEASVNKAYDSSLLVRILVFIGAAGFSLGFISHVIRHWLKGED